MSSSVTYHKRVLVNKEKGNLVTLQSRVKWKGISRNLQVGDVLLVRNDQARNHWPIARIIKIEEDQYGIVRSVKLKVAGSKSNETDKNTDITIGSFGQQR